MPYKDRATYLAKQLEYAARRRAAKKAGNPLPLPEKKCIVRSNPRADNPVPGSITPATPAFKPDRNHVPIARPVAARMSDRVSPAVGLSVFDLAISAVSVVYGSTSDLRPTHKVPARAPAAVPGRPTCAAVPTPAKQTRNFRLPEHMQGGGSKRSHPGMVRLFKTLFG